MGSAQCVTLWYPPNLNPTCCELICTQCLDFQLETALNVDHGSDTLPFSPSRKEVDAADKYYLYTNVSAWYMECGSVCISESSLSSNGNNLDCIFAIRCFPSLPL